MYVQTLFIYLHPTMQECESKYCKCLYYSANALSRIMTKMADEAFATTGLSSSYAVLLITVNDKPGIQPKEISKQMQLRPSTVTRLVEKMEQRGFLERKQVGRTTEVYPTETSLELNPKIKAAWKNLYQNYSDKLGQDIGDKLTDDIYNAVLKLE